MSDPTPTQEQLPALVAQGLALVESRLSKDAGSGLYGSIHNQLRWIEGALAASEPPDPERLDALLLGHYAARELENTDPEVADVLFAVQYLVNRRWL
jgi:hypothetical protein